MSAPVPDVKAATQRAQQELDWLRCHKEASLEAWQEHVRAYVLERFLLDREEEEEGQGQPGPLHAPPHQAEEPGGVVGGEEVHLGPDHLGAVAAEEVLQPMAEGQGLEGFYAA